jgi:hypothetical protein
MEESIMFFKIALFVSLLSVITNVRKANFKSEAGCESAAYVLFGIVGTIIALSYIFGGGIS